MLVAATVFLILFTLAGTVDGIYYHLKKYRLHSHPDSLYEHRLHTARAVLFVPIVLLLFYRNFGGVFLWAGIVLVLIDQTVEFLDAYAEKASRNRMGGLPAGEYVTHIAAITFRVAAITLILAAKPREAWGLTNTVVDPPYPAALRWIALILMVSGILGALQHLRQARSTGMSETEQGP